MTRFGQWLQDNEISHAQAAKRLGVTRQFIWLLSAGQNKPGDSLARTIARWTKGVVAAESWER